MYSQEKWSETIGIVKNKKANLTLTEFNKIWERLSEEEKNKVLELSHKKFGKFKDMVLSKKFAYEEMLERSI